MRLKILLFIRIFMLFTTNCVTFTIKNNGSGVHWHNCWVLITLNKRMALAHWHSVLLISLKPNSAAIIPYWLCNSCLLFIVGQLNRCQDHFIIDIRMVSLCIYSMESICRFGSFYLHQNRFPGHNLCYIGNIAFVVSAPAVIVVMQLGQLCTFACDILFNHLCKGSFIHSTKIHVTESSVVPISICTKTFGVVCIVIFILPYQMIS